MPLRYVLVALKPSKGSSQNHTVVTSHEFKPIADLVSSCVFSMVAFSPLAIDLQIDLSLALSLLSLSLTESALSLVYWT
jgi:hypothetical protein